MVKKTIMLNGLITLAGLLLDIYGLYDLSFFPALSGLCIGVVDCATFLWMREEIKRKFVQWRNTLRQTRPYVTDTWFQDMEKGKFQVTATITGQSVFNRVLRLAKKLGYEPADLSESRSRTFKKYTVTFKRTKELEPT